ncbi:MAG TPA: hypothetical protein DCR47_07345 [Cryomorphaceae bacterium]|jgi:hypothetical protein|nr:hypothetical protein [Cryomorphaceae bacterium]
MRYIYILLVFGLIACERDPLYYTSDGSTNLVALVNKGNESPMVRVKNINGTVLTYPFTESVYHICRVDTNISTPWIDSTYIKSKFENIEVYILSQNDTLYLSDFKVYNIDSYNLESDDLINEIMYVRNDTAHILSQHIYTYEFNDSMFN